MRDHRDDGDAAEGCAAAAIGSVILVIGFIIITRLAFGWF